MAEVFTQRRRSLFERVMDSSGRVTSICPPGTCIRVVFAALCWAGAEPVNATARVEIKRNTKTPDGKQGRGLRRITAPEPRPGFAACCDIAGSGYPKRTVPGRR